MIVRELAEVFYVYSIGRLNGDVVGIIYQYFTYYAKTCGSAVIDIPFAQKYLATTRIRFCLLFGPISVNGIRLERAKIGIKN